MAVAHSDMHGSTGRSGVLGVECEKFRDRLPSSINELLARVVNFKRTPMRIAIYMI